MLSIKILKECCAPYWLTLLEKNMEDVSVKPKQILFAEGDSVKGVYFVNDGKFKVLSKVNKDEHQIIRLAGNGMILGHRGFHAKHYPITAVALTDSTLKFIPYKLFFDLIQANPKLSISLIEFLSDELRETEERVKGMRILDPKQRIAIILLKLIEAYGLEKNKNLGFTLSRNDIANMAGVTYETMIRTLSFFKKNKYISFEGKEIRILDLKKLQTIAKVVASKK